MLAQPSVATFATKGPDGRVHAVPVWFGYQAGKLRVITERASVKARNAIRAGRATLCVVRAEGDDLRYVSVEGPVAVEACTPAERRTLWTRYRDEVTAERMAAGDISSLCVLVIAPERVISAVE